MILVVGNDRAAVDKLRIAFYRNNLPTGAASVPTFQYHMNKGIYDFVILLGGKDIFLRHFFRRLHRTYPSVPSILLGEPSKTQTEAYSLPDLVISGSYTPVSLIKEIDRIARRRGMERNPIHLRVGTLAHDIKNAGFFCFHACFTPRPAEAAILHVLMDRYPEAPGAKELLKLASKPGRELSPSSLSPAVSRLNRLATENIGRRVVLSQNGFYRYIERKE